jgi:hypothetical protein
VYAAAVPLIVTEQLNDPSEATVGEQAEIVPPVLIDVVMVALGVNPVPVTPTDTPVGPWVGLNTMPGLVIVNGALALSK